MVSQSINRWTSNLHRRERLLALVGEQNDARPQFAECVDIGDGCRIAHDDGLPLVQVLFDLLGFPHQEGDMLLGRFGEPRQLLHGLVEFLDKLIVLLIGARFEPAWSSDPRSMLSWFISSPIEPLQMLRESPQFHRIDNSFGHGLPLL